MYEDLVRSRCIYKDEGSQEGDFRVADCPGILQYLKFILPKSNSQTEKVQLKRPLSMLGVETLHLIPMILAWYTCEAVTVVAPGITGWKPVGWFLKFRLEEFLTAHWYDIIDDICIDSPKYRKYLVEELINQHGNVCNLISPLRYRSKLVDYPLIRCL